MQTKSTDYEKLLRTYPEQMNDYCTRLTRAHPELRPLYYADPRELTDSPDLPPDGLGETRNSPCPHLIRTYHDRALILTTDRCFVRCRFCFRKRLWRDGASPFALSDDDLQNILSFLLRHPEVDDVLLSGGDPLTLSDSRLLEILSGLQRVSSVRTIRICSRAPAVEPARITPELARALASVDGLWFLCHFNHPAELTPEAESACRLLVSNGIPMLNQTVLLAGINDKSEILSSLFKRLAALRVKPHYLFHIDPVQGVAHFATGIEKGLQLMESFRFTLSSIARPDFAIDLPHGAGKVVLAPNEQFPDGAFLSCITGKPVRHPLA